MAQKPVDQFKHSMVELQDSQFLIQKELLLTRTEIQAQVDTLMTEIAMLHARLVRLDALGDRLTRVAKLTRGEFDFSQNPALGGPEVNSVVAASESLEQRLERSMAGQLQQLDQLISDRSRQLEILEAMLESRHIGQGMVVTRRPILKGWMSSAFGRRTDPFTGKPAWHAGVDFAGKQGSNIIAVAPGVVTWSGKRSSYGKMVETDHGDGYVTRYAHADKLLVNKGDVISQGDYIAKMGSSGRSTGPHVHFEVYKQGRVVDPKTYLNRRH
ncbi:MAG: peptidoglycan DD-metalloendopeptidase family protein [Pseudomonadales bacterium]|nr:peptidoglycan DD-metalloendopeptidase family protein [Pseudomonadales bacterium]